MMARSGRELGKAEGAQLPAERRFADRDAEAVPNPGDQVHEPPPHDLIDRWVRPAFDHINQRSALRVVKL